MSVPNGPSPNPPAWMLIFQDLLCQVYRKLGGDCSWLTWADGGATAVATVQAAFQTHGPPTFGSQLEADEYRQTLDDLEAHLGAPDITISAQVAQAVQTLIDDLRTALGW